MQAAEKLFASRSIDSVSLNEITVAAGQKNRTALRYHFGSRDGLLQAIIDRHAIVVQALRREYFDSLDSFDKPGNDESSACRVAARGLVLPLGRHIETDASGAHYVRILSQLAALNSKIVNPASRSALSFHTDQRLTAVMEEAVAHLPAEEAQRRFFLLLSITFHGLADICRAAEADNVANTLTLRSAMIEQVALAVESLLAAPAITRATAARPKKPSAPAAKG
ncbi:MAG: TetR family transcriptional regulator [Halioglobus sp.]